MKKTIGKIAVGLILFSLLPAAMAAKDIYISSNGKGKNATKEQPAKDMGNIIELLEPGDTVHIAGGIYTGKGNNGTDEINVPVNIIGGYDETFTNRDPWGKFRTIMSGDNLTKNYMDTARIFINLSKWKKDEVYPVTIDGLIIDNSNRNHYKTKEQLMIVRTASPKEGKNPTPESGGIVIWIPGTLNNEKAGFNVTVSNCVVANTAPTQGALTIRGGRLGKALVINNLIINNTGVGIHLSSAYHGTEKIPEFAVENNTVLFTWKYDELVTTYSGESLLVDADVKAIVENNVLGIADRIGITKKGKEKMLLKDNYIFGNLDTDYYEAITNMKIKVADLDDEATTLAPDSNGNSAEQFAIPAGDVWINTWAGRTLLEPNLKAAELKLKMELVNDIRSRLGLPLLTGKEKTTVVAIWLPCISIDDAIAAGSKTYNAKGCGLP